MKIGMVGLPNAGKSTLFNAFMKEYLAQAANYPFCTIEPNIGKMPVVDSRLDKLAEIVNPKRKIYTRLDCVDIAGLIKGASKGEGLGNAFLDNIRDIDLIVHVVRAFKEADTKLEPTVKHDIEIIKTELLLSDLQRIERYIEKNKKTRVPELEYAIKAQKILDQGERLGKDLGAEELKFFKNLGLLTIKPCLFVANVAEADKDKTAGDNIYLKDEHNMIICCAEYEFNMTQNDDAKNAEKTFTALDNIITQAYNALDLITFFTAGVEEVRAWTAKKADYIHHAAGAIHTDFSDKFIRAEVVSYDDFVRLGGWDGARKAGKLRVEGKKYVIQDGDVCYFKI